jgi:hypothetical protein
MSKDRRSLNFKDVAFPFQLFFSTAASIRQRSEEEDCGRLWIGLQGVNSLK